MLFYEIQVILHNRLSIPIIFLLTNLINGMLNSELSVLVIRIQFFLHSHFKFEFADLRPQ